MERPNPTRSRHHVRGYKRTHQPERRPDPKNDRELRWFFAQGRTPTFDSDEDRMRWLHTASALNGRGYQLMLLHTRGWHESAELLCREYSHFLQHRRDPSPEPYLVVAESTYFAILNANKSPSKILEAQSRFSSSSSLVARSNKSAYLSSGSLNDLEKYRSTWGEIRVDLDSARLCLELGCGLSLTESRALFDIEVFDMLEGRTLAVERDETALPQSEARRKDSTFSQRIQNLTGANFLNDWRVDNRLNPQWWAARKELLDVGAGETTTSRLARILPGISSAKIRDRLIRLACPNAELARTPLPLSWFGSERAYDFWSWVVKEHVGAMRQKRALSFSRYGRRRRR